MSLEKQACECGDLLDTRSNVLENVKQGKRSWRLRCLLADNSILERRQESDIDSFDEVKNNETRMSASHGLPFISAFHLSLHSLSISSFCWKIQSRIHQRTFLAATRLGHDFAIVRYQILAYAERNDFCYSSVKNMIEQGELSRHNNVAPVWNSARHSTIVECDFRRNGGHIYKNKTPCRFLSVIRKCCLAKGWMQLPPALPC